MSDGEEVGGYCEETDQSASISSHREEVGEGGGGRGGGLLAVNVPEVNGRLADGRQEEEERERDGKIEAPVEATSHPTARYGGSILASRGSPSPWSSSNLNCTQKTLSMLENKMI